MLCLMFRYLLLFLLLNVFSGEALHAAAEKPLVRFGINMRHSPISLYEHYQPLMDYLTRNTPYRFELKVGHTYRQVLKDLEEGKTQIASLGDGAFIDAILFHGATPVVKPLNREGKPYYRCVIVVQNRSPLTGIAAVRNMNLALGSPHSVSGNLVPWLMLGKEGISTSDLAYYRNLNNHSSVAKAVLKGIFDAGALKDVFADRFKKDLRTLAVSEPIPTAPLVAGGAVSKELIASVAAALLKLNPTNPADKRIMAEWDREFQYGFAPANSADYQDLFRKFKSVPNGCSTGCHQ